jgi:hypothetical protein
MNKKFYLGPKFGTLFNNKWITISELLQSPFHLKELIFHKNFRGIFPWIYFHHFLHKNDKKFFLLKTMLNSTGLFHIWWDFWAKPWGKCLDKYMYFGYISYVYLSGVKWVAVIMLKIWVCIFIREEHWAANRNHA